MKITSDWPREHEMPLVFDLYAKSRPRRSSGEIDWWPEDLLALTLDSMRQVLPKKRFEKLLWGPSTMILRTWLYGKDGPREILAACTYIVSYVGTENTVVVSRWAVCPDLPPNQQKRLAVALFDALDRKINTGDAVVTVVSEYDLWRQILLRDRGFQFLCAVDMPKCRFGRPPTTLYRFVRVKE